jgi:hypothetical protein
MPIETIKELYSSINADFIKWDKSFNRVYLNEHRYVLIVPFSLPIIFNVLFEKEKENYELI